VALDELNGQAGFTHATSPDHDQLVFSQKLCQDPVSNFHLYRAVLGRKRTFEAIGLGL